MDAGLNETVNWAWGISLIALTITIHTMGVVFMTFMTAGIRSRVEARNFAQRHLIPFVIGMLGSVGFLLTVLHGIEVGLWAIAYQRLGALDSRLAAILYSIDAMSTRGASGVTMHGDWLLMGALEAFDGMLLFGISTAYMFSTMQIFWRALNPSSEIASSRDLS